MINFTNRRFARIAFPTCLTLGEWDVGNEMRDGISCYAANRSLGANGSQIVIKAAGEDTGVT